MDGAVGFLQDAFVILGLVIMTVGVYGVVRFPDVYARLHAASKAVFLGVVSILVATCLSGGADVILRAVLIGAFLLLTTPVSAHAIARAAYQKNQPMRTPGAVNESDRDLTHGEEQT
ncbi:MAG: monovalent cation/H(+) antiporter subunit G [Rubrobacteraceae bacterium]